MMFGNTIICHERSHVVEVLLTKCIVLSYFPATVSISDLNLLMTNIT